MVLESAYLDWHVRLTREARIRWPGCEAEDLASQALWRCWEAEQRGQEISLTYAYRALHSCWISAYRTEHAEKRTLPDDLRIPQAYSLHLTERLEIEEALAEFPVSYGQVFRWIAEGHTGEQIAEALGIPMTAYRKRLQRMRSQAQRRYQHLRDDLRVS